MKTVFFKAVQTIEELKIQYKKLALKLHPDMKEGNEKLFIAMKEEFDKLYKLLEKGEKNAWQHTKAEQKFGSFQSIIDKLIFMEKGDIEIVGSWIWIWGIEKTDKDIHTFLKSLGFEFAKGKNGWYLGQKGKWRKSMTKDEMRQEFGSEKVEKVAKPKPKTLKPVTEE